MASETPATQFVKFTFYRVDPALRALAPREKEELRQGFSATLAKFEDSLILRTYSLVGTRGDCDFLVWAIGQSVDDLQALHAALNQTGLARFLTTPHGFLSVTRRSQYVRAHAAEDPGGHGSMRTIVPGSARYLFVYPFWKTAEWYQLPKDERQAMMNEHFRIGHKYPEIKIHTTYSFGIDDPEFVLAFEGEDPSQFVDLVMELREAKQRPYTLRDTPIFTCIKGDVLTILKQVG